MNRWTRVNLLLGLLLALLLALQLWPQRPDAGRIPLTDLAPQAIETIRVERGRRLVVALQRAGDGWTMTHPRQSAAIDRRVAQLLAIAQAPVTFRYPASDTPARFGLEPPAAVLQLDALRLAFGDRDPTQTGRYVRVGDEVRVVDDLYFNLLTLPASHFAAD